jgi:protein-S-isoprenylcysteine O-methyltransferase Ste14
MAGRLCSLITVLVCIMTTRHHWSDWAGFTVFSFMWVSIVMKAPTLGLMTLPVFLHPFLTSIGFAFRRQPVKVIAGFMPRLASYGSTFGVALFFLVMEKLRPEWVAAEATPLLRNLGVAIWFAGGLLDAYVVWWLRHSMSIVPQARKLITNGPYRYARHPLYAVYVVELFGLWLRFANPAVAVAFLSWFALTLLRIRYEESVLAAAFPEYQAYRVKVGKFCPRLRLLGTAANYRTDPPVEPSRSRQIA